MEHVERRVAGGWALRMAMSDGLRNIVKRPSQAVMLLLSVAIGVALALTIIAASNGVEQKVSDLLAIDPRPPQIDFDAIFAVLGDTRGLLTDLAFAFTAVLVGVVTWLSIGRRRREIAIKRQNGFHVWQVLAELWTEATVLCSAGGLAGVWLGYWLCDRLQRTMPSLPLRPERDDVVLVFPVVVVLSFLATAAVASYFALRPRSDQEL